MARISVISVPLPASMTLLAAPSGAASAQTASSPIDSAQPSLRPVSEMHFLIHPLFVGDPWGERDGTWMLARSERARNMTARYMAQAGRLGENAIMCAFMHLGACDFQLRKDSYIARVNSLISELKSVLGMRFMVFSNELDPFNSYAVVAMITREMKRRGFVLGDTPRGFAYGETLEECVHKAAENLGEGFDFAEPVTVPLSLTDAVFWWHSISGSKQKHVRTTMIESGLRLVEDL